MNHFMVLLAVIATQFAQLSITQSSGEKRGKCQKLAKKPSLLTLHMQLYNMLIFQFPDWAIFDAVYSRYRWMERNTFIFTHSKCVLLSTDE